MSQGLLTSETFQKGMLVNDQSMTGVVQRGSGTFAVFTTDLTSAETTGYREFLELAEALQFANAAAPQSHFESFGCSKGSSCKGAQRGACEGCDHSVAASPHV